MTEIVEAVKLAGAIVGLFTGIFVVADRLLLFRPIVTWDRIADQMGIRIKNSAGENVIIESIDVEPKGWALAWTDDLHDTIEAAAKAIKFENDKPDEMSFVLGPGCDRYFYCVRSDG